MLTGSLTLDGVKMSKSLGNTLTVKEALARWRPEAIRTFILSSHYSNPIDLSDDAVEAASKGWQRIWGAVTLVRSQMRDAAVGEIDSAVQEMLDITRAGFIQKMNDDFNAPAALAVLQDLTRQVNTLLNKSGLQTQATLEAIDQVYRELGGEVLGIIPDQLDHKSGGDRRENGLLQLLVDLRAEARSRKDWTTSDQIRERLNELGVTLEDRPDGTLWKLE
jgi:cysteinyl-tRNA synthetase